MVQVLEKTVLIKNREHVVSFELKENYWDWMELSTRD
jgi:hypothetical protein